MITPRPRRDSRFYEAIFGSRARSRPKSRQCQIVFGIPPACEKRRQRRISLSLSLSRLRRRVNLPINKRNGIYLRVEWMEPVVGWTARYRRGGEHGFASPRIPPPPPSQCGGLSSKREREGEHRGRPFEFHSRKNALVGVGSASGRASERESEREKQRGGLFSRGLEVIDIRRRHAATQGFTTDRAAKIFLPGRACPCRCWSISPSRTRPPAFVAGPR